MDSRNLYRGEHSFLELFVLFQRGIETAAAAARWTAKPLVTASSLIAYTVISLEFAAFRLYLAALPAHDLMISSTTQKMPSWSRTMRKGPRWVWAGCSREDRA